MLPTVMGPTLHQGRWMVNGDDEDTEFNDFLYYS